ncbi:MAG: APC family permease [Acidobacteria bacterium]|nr:APC family permease [Acidobacteriota bacterium]
MGERLVGSDDGSDEIGQNGRLLRILGVGFGIAVTVGGTIGVGILRTPGMVAEQLGSPWLIAMIWVCGGLYALLGTVFVAELGTMLPQVGGWYVYARRAFGRYGGFLIGWSDWLAQSGALAYLAVAIGEFTGQLLERPDATFEKSVAVATLLAFAALHWIGIRAGSWTQELTSLLKALAFIAFVVFCFAVGAPPDSPAGTVRTPGFPAIIVAVVIALQSIVVTYDGWYSAIYFTEEDRDPGRNLPRSLIAGILCTIGIYVLVNLALLYALPIQSLAASRLPAADVAANIFGPYGGRIITALCILSLLSILNAVLLLTPRILLAMGRDGLFWRRATSVNRGGTPDVAMVLSTIAGILLVMSGTFEKLVAITSFFYVFIYTSGVVALFVLRRREPGLRRPFHNWGHPWAPAIFLLGSFAFLIGSVWGDIENSTYALALIAISYPLFGLLYRRKRSM